MDTFLVVTLSVLNLKSSTTVPGFLLLVKIISILETLVTKYLSIKKFAQTYCETCLRFAKTYAYKARSNIFAQTYCSLKRIVPISKAQKSHLCAETLFVKSADFFLSIGGAKFSVYACKYR